jgi:broad specificity phosphatase PhoE
LDVIRIMFIRHAEKPEGDDPDQGTTAKGIIDPESLTPRGWQRAGALARFFRSAAGDGPLTPSVVFAAGIGHGSNSKRPIETVRPLVKLLNETRETPFITRYLKDDHQDLVHDILRRKGVVLVSWEHKVIPKVIAFIPDAPPTPSDWPDDRFDVVWVLERAADGWRFSQIPQLLLAGDSAVPIT